MSKLRSISGNVCPVCVSSMPKEIMQLTGVMQALAAPKMVENSASCVFKPAGSGASHQPKPEIKAAETFRRQLSPRTASPHRTVTGLKADNPSLTRLMFLTHFDSEAKLRVAGEGWLNVCKDFSCESLNIVSWSCKSKSRCYSFEKVEVF